MGNMHTSITKNKRGFGLCPLHPAIFTIKSEIGEPQKYIPLILLNFLMVREIIV